MHFNILNVIKLYEIWLIISSFKRSKICIESISEKQSTARAEQINLNPFWCYHYAGKDALKWRESGFSEQNTIILKLN